MLEKLKKQIMEGNFELARSLYNKNDYEILEHDIHVIAYDTENVATYFFILYSRRLIANNIASFQTSSDPL